MKRRRSHDSGFRRSVRRARAIRLRLVEMTASRLTRHDSGSGWLAGPFPYDSFIHDSTPVLSRRTQHPASTEDWNFTSSYWRTLVTMTKSSSYQPKAHISQNLSPWASGRFTDGRFSHHIRSPCGKSCLKRLTDLIPDFGAVSCVTTSGLPNCMIWRSTFAKRNTTVGAKSRSPLPSRCQ